MEKKIIYLDNAATTRVGKEVVAEMGKYYSEEYGNPSSIHALGEETRKAIDRARGEIAREIGARTGEIVFTSGTTESNNMALLGVAKSELGRKKRKIIVSAIEHSSIFEISSALKKEGFKIVEIPVNREGIVDIGRIGEEVDGDTLLVSVMHVNNEIGTIQDLGKIGRICRERGAYFHTDCAQSFGKLKIDVKGMGIDLLSAGAHKIGGPKGIGILYVREGVKIEPIIYGLQERGLRGGTENVPGIMGFAKALEIMRGEDKNKIKEVRDYFVLGLEKIGGKINGSKKERIYNNVNVCFDGKDGEGIVLALSEKGVMCSTGSACESRKKSEKVLRAIGLNEEESNGSLRFSLSSEVGKKDVDKVLRELKLILKR